MSSNRGIVSVNNREGKQQLPYFFLELFVLLFLDCDGGLFLRRIEQNRVPYFTFFSGGAACCSYAISMSLQPTADVKLARKTIPINVTYIHPNTED